jgi:hypothetical protein
VNFHTLSVVAFAVTLRARRASSVTNASTSSASAATVRAMTASGTRFRSASSSSERFPASPPTEAGGSKGREAHEEHRRSDQAPRYELYLASLGRVRHPGQLVLLNLSNDDVETATCREGSQIGVLRVVSLSRTAFLEEDNPRGGGADWRT